ncbi:uncharacterized protein LOC105846161 isoform X1 [Hydra vulgaris]|uniref:uncharacterized protein LOC105846161 isoform X1 n=1 Tax=Hydra vulgaris TaxID=6087 RepID=UPI0006412D6F|nr:uncharacterized protein LOC105846161 [Hydra vulgaris]
MSVKTIATVSCSIFCIVIIILSLVTNYWYEFEEELSQDRKTLVKSVFEDKSSNHSVIFTRVGLWEQCNTVIYNHLREDEKEMTEKCESYKVPSYINNWTIRRNVLVIFYIISLLLTLVAFAFETIYCVTRKYYFPVGRIALCFFISALLILISLSVYTNTFIRQNIAFSWSYGAGWSAVVMYIISIVLLYADK